MYKFFFPPCKNCGEPTSACDSCDKNVCLKCKDIPENDPEQNKRSFPTQPHALCAECKGIPVCHINTICGLCVKDYHFITDKVAIGSSLTPYDQFDIVINMDCPNNGVAHGEMKYEYLSHNTHNNTHLIKCGIQDCSLDEYEPFATKVFEEIHKTIVVLKKRGEKYENYKEKGHKYPKYRKYPKILFHCYAGVSRSVTAAIYYLSKDTEMSTKAIYHMVKEKRKVARPNPCFMKILGLEDILSNNNNNNNKLLSNY